MSFLINIQAKTNDYFSDKNLEIAWNGYDHYWSGNDICFKQPRVILARLSIFSYWFDDHPFNNRFQDTLKSFEVKAHEQEIKIKRLKRRQIFMIIGSVSGGILTGYLTYKGLSAIQ